MPTYPFQRQRYWLEAEKAMRLVQLCDTFHLPIVSFADEPGFMVGIESEKQGIVEIQQIKSELEGLRNEVDQATRRGDLQKAAELRYGRLADLERRLQAEEEQLNRFGDRRLLREVVTEEEIAEIVSAWTGIPVSRLQEGEREKLLRLDLHPADLDHPRHIGAVEGVLKRARRHVRQAVTYDDLA